MWQQVYAEQNDIMEVMAVPGGYLYRNRLVIDGSAQAAGGFVWGCVMAFAPPGAPVLVDVPYVEGEGTVGETLTCTMGNWMGMPNAYAYQWQSGGADVGTDANTYAVADTDVGKSITCTVTATNSEGSTTSQ